MGMNNQTEILLESGTNELEIMEFTVGGEIFGINVAKVREIMMYCAVKPMQNSHPVIEGVFKPRQELITVINLADYLGLPPSQDMMQLGGNDQWANILGGIKLTRRVTGDDVYGMTFTLLTTKEGKKMGKTENGAVWLDPEKTSPYEFFQYWRNVADDDVINCLKLLTFVPIEEIEAMEKWEGSQLNKAKEILAHELTKMVHGQQEADKALEAARAIFAGGTHSDDMPTTSLVSSDLADGAISVADLLVKTGLAPSKGEAKRLIQQGGVSVDDVKVSDFAAVIGKESFDKGQVILKKGKKIYHKVLLG